MAMGLEKALSAPLEQVREQTIAAVFALNRDIGIPASLSAVGMRADDIPALAAAAFADVCTGGNPREASVAEIVALYHQAC
ncbi:Lactaldehyde reductase [Yersinia kristensenii ATCC 33638]|nr:Lactaldehyde reductase [Yersinia kristensenii ATCC 33638]